MAGSLLLAFVVGAAAKSLPEALGSPIRRLGGRGEVRVGVVLEGETYVCCNKHGSGQGRFGRCSSSKGLLSA